MAGYICDCTIILVAILGNGEKVPSFHIYFHSIALIVTAIFSAFLWKETIYVESGIGATLLVIGLNGVLWGKNKEWSAAANELKQIMKAETVVMGGITIER